MFLYVYKKDWLGSWSFFLWVLEIFPIYVSLTN